MNPWATQSSDPHPLYAFKHRSNPVAIVKEGQCYSRECPRGCWLKRAFRRAEANWDALLERQQLEVDEDGLEKWQETLYVGSYNQRTWESTSKSFQKSRGVEATGLRVPTTTHFVVVVLVGRKSPLPGGMSVLPIFLKKESGESTDTIPGQSDFGMLSAGEMRYWDNRIDALYGIPHRPDWRYLLDLKTTLHYSGLEGGLFRLFLNRPVGPGTSNISPIGRYWTDPRLRWCLGADAPPHPSKWWLSGWVQPEELSAEDRERAEEERWVYNQVGEDKLCLYCNSHTESGWQEKTRLTGASLSALHQRARRGHYHPDGSGFTWNLLEEEGDSYDDFVARLQGTPPTREKRDTEEMARTLYDSLSPETAEQLSESFRDEIARRRNRDETPNREETR